MGSPNHILILTDYAHREPHSFTVPQPYCRHHLSLRSHSAFITHRETLISYSPLISYFNIVSFSINALIQPLSIYIYLTTFMQFCNPKITPFSALNSAYAYLLKIETYWYIWIWKIKFFHVMLNCVKQTSNSQISIWTETLFHKMYTENLVKDFLYLYVNTDVGHLTICLVLK